MFIVFLIVPMTLPSFYDRVAAGGVITAFLLGASTKDGRPDPRTSLDYVQEENRHYLRVILSGRFLRHAGVAGAGAPVHHQPSR